MRWLMLLLIATQLLAAPPPVLDSRGIIQFPAGAGPTKNGEIGYVGGALRGYDSGSSFSLRNSGSSGSSGPTTGVILGLSVTCYDTDSVTITCAGISLNSTLSSSVQWATSVNVTATTIVSGLGGLETGTSDSVSTWYSIWVVGDGQGQTRALLSDRLGTSAPVIPVGWGWFRFVGRVRNDASGNFVQFAQQGDLVHPFVSIGGGDIVLSNGNATEWTTVDASAFVPPEAVAHEYAWWTYKATTNFQYHRLSPGGWGGNLYVQTDFGAVTNIRTVQMITLPIWNGNISFDYVCTHSSYQQTLALKGYKLNLR